MPLWVTGNKVTEIYYLADEFCRKDVVKHGDRSNSLSDVWDHDCFIEDVYSECFVLA